MPNQRLFSPIYAVWAALADDVVLRSLFLRGQRLSAPEAHHDHLIDVESGKVVKFVDPELEALQKQIAEKLGYRLVDHRMELYGVRLERDN